jgi:DNA helicase HerA-like ATPase
MSYKIINSRDQGIGRTIASEKFLNTMDGFWFALHPNVIINSFDFVTVDNLFDSNTIGIVKELQSVAEDEYKNYFSDYQKISTTKEEQLREEKKDKDQERNLPLSNTQLSGVVVAKVAIMANTEFKAPGYKKNISINFPVGVGKTVRFATEEEIIFALGMPQMENPIPAGIIETTNGLEVPITLDITYLAGADTAHVNASGISGNRKSSYILFLLQSSYQTLKRMNQNVGLIIFNTKEQDLLYLDQKEKHIKKRTERLFDILDLDIEPFENVTYFLPRGKDGKPNSIHIPKNYKTYSYELKDVYDRLELLFSEPYDLHHDFSSIINYISEYWPLKSTMGNKIETWSDLTEFKEYPEAIISKKSSLLFFLGRLQRFRKSSMFIDKKKTSSYLGSQIKNIKAGEVFVIDVATISSFEEQAFVVGDVMKSIDEMYSARYYNLKDDKSDNNNTKIDNDKNNFQKNQKLNYILVFIDEINRYISKSQKGIMNSVSEQIMRTVIAGRTRGTILFSAQQFKSATDYRLQENTDLHITAKLGLSELYTEPYSMLDESTKMNIVRLNKGELVMIHSAFRHPIKIGFPKATFKKPK